MPDQPAPSARLAAAPRSRRRVSLTALAAATVLGIAFVLYSALSPSHEQPASRPGAAAVDTFTAQTLQGAQITVPDGSRPSVLFFFSIGCGGCGPTAQALGDVAKAAGANATFVAVDIDPGVTDQSIKEFLIANQATRLAYTHDATTALMSAYQANQVSTVIVLDSSGKTTFRAVEPSADTIGAELGKVGA